MAMQLHFRPLSTTIGVEAEGITPIELASKDVPSNVIDHIAKALLQHSVVLIRAVTQI
eukprot:m.59991 g.59991  ORF g.59991 m.59991 type:complete len:58 (+) comp22785_c1_seq2:117-290(+)